MSTKNHKAATTSDIVSGNPTINPQIQQSNNPVPSPLDTRHSDTLPPKSSLTNATRARCGKVARLPKEIRDQLNEMLLDGVPHHQIIQKLHNQFGPQSNVVPIEPTDASVENGSNDSNSNSDHASRITNHAPPNTNHASDSPSTPDTRHSDLLASLTPRHITNWKKFGGYRDWLQHQHRIEECKLRHELTLDLARSAEGLASYQAAPKVAVAQICQTIIDLGPDGLKDAMKASPLNCFRLLNALARLINSGLKCEQQIQKTATKQRGGMTRARFARIEKNLNLM